MHRWFDAQRDQKILDGIYWLARSMCFRFALLRQMQIQIYVAVDSLTNCKSPHNWKHGLNTALIAICNTYTKPNEFGTSFSVLKKNKQPS
jgi:hypothetical protein